MCGGEQLGEMRLDCQQTYFHQLSLKAGQNFKNLLLSIPLGERALGGTGWTGSVAVHVSCQSKEQRSSQGN